MSLPIVRHTLNTKLVAEVQLAIGEGLGQGFEMRDSAKSVNCQWLSPFSRLGWVEVSKSAGLQVGLKN